MSFTKASSSSSSSSNSSTRTQLLQFFYSDNQKTLNELKNKNITSKSQMSME